GRHAKFPRCQPDSRPAVAGSGEAGGGRGSRRAEFRDHASRNRARHLAYAHSLAKQLWPGGSRIVSAKPTFSCSCVRARRARLAKEESCWLSRLVIQRSALGPLLLC